MAEAVVNVVIEQLVSATTEWLMEEISMIMGVENELDNMSTKMQMIQTVLNDAENRSVKEIFVQEWLDRLQDVSYQMEDVLDEWNTIVNIHKLEEAEKNNTKISSSSASSSKFTCLPFNCFKSVKQVGWRRDIASRIKIINQKVESLFNEMDEFEFISSKIRSVAPDAPTMNNFEIDRTTTSLVNKSLIHGRDAEKEVLLSKLLCENSEGGDDISVVSIVGLGGLGKTTLAQLVYNDEKVINGFEKRIWVCVSNTFDEFKVARGILEGLRVSHVGMDELQTLHQSVQSSLSKHKFLLVLDDVWNEDLGKWERLRACLGTGAQGSRILITTRNDKVARIMNTSNVNMLRPRLISETDCWLLISHVAFQGKGKDEVRKFENIGREIARKCKGLPLAAKTLGGLLILKNTTKDWKEVLNSEIWELKKAETELFPHLFLSYRELPSTLKRCFIFFSIFPKDYEIKVVELITLWIANGYINATKEMHDLEHVGQEYFRYLLSRSFFQARDTWRSSTLASMHDIMHDFALHLSRDNFLTSTNDDSHPESTSLKFHKSKKAHHLFINGEIPFPVSDVGRLRTCLAKIVPQDVTLDMLRHLKLVRSLSLIECDLDVIPQEIGKLIHLRTLDLSRNYSVKELPETVGDLYNLKYLFLEGLALNKFPQSIGKLTNLSTLTVDPEKWKLLAPDSLGKLVNLRRLNKLCEVNVKAGPRGLRFLKNLNQLRGDLELVFESDYNDEVDANEAKLKSKKHIRKLTFNFRGKHVSEVVVEALEPSTDVEEVKIVFFRGTKLPSWITSLRYMTKLEVSSAENIVSLPPLGKLPHLEKLKIHKLPALKFIGRDFLGIDDNSDKGITIANQPPSSSSSTIAFPALEELVLHFLIELEKWEDLKVEEEHMTNVMPKLKILTIKGCPKLEIMPLRILLKASLSLKRLVLDKIGLSSNLRFTADEGTIRTILLPFHNLEKLTLLNYMALVLPSWISCLNFLTKLDLHGAEEVQSLPPLGKLPFLKILSIKEFSALKFIGREFLGIDIERKVNTSRAAAAAASVSSSSSTKIEGIEEDNNQKNIISTSIISFPKLKELTIYDCSELEVLEDITAEEDVDDHAITLMQNLWYLTIKYCPKLQVLPHRLLRRASSLRELWIRECGIKVREKIVEDVQLLSRLQKVRVDDEYLKGNNPGWAKTKEGD